MSEKSRILRDILHSVNNNSIIIYENIFTNEDNKIVIEANKINKITELRC